MQQVLEDLSDGSAAMHTSKLCRLCCRCMHPRAQEDKREGRSVPLGCFLPWKRRRRCSSHAPFVGGKARWHRLPCPCHSFARPTLPSKPGEILLVGVMPVLARGWSHDRSKHATLQALVVELATHPRLRRRCRSHRLRSTWATNRRPGVSHPGRPAQPW